MMSVYAYAGPRATTYQAKIIKPDGLPLEAANVNFKFTILDNGGSCILYAETYSAVNMTSSAGLVSFSLGTGLKTYPVSATTFENVFSNITPNLSCDAGGPPSYSPQAHDSRKIVMQFQDGTGWQTLPAMNINAVPYAMYANDAQKLGGVSATAFVQRNEFTTCSGGEAVFYNGTNFTCVPASGGGSVTSGSVISALGFSPVSSTVINAVSTYAANVSSTVFSVSSTVSALENTVTSLSNSVAASFSAITNSQWATSGTSISYTNGNVGIGTTSPSLKLTVVETAPTDVYMGLSRPAGYVGGMVYATGLTPRWITYTTAQPEGGSETGSNFAIVRYSDTGSYIGPALAITRSNGHVALGGMFSAATALDVSGGVRIGLEAGTCNAGLSGTLRYNSGVVEYCNGTAWAAFGVSGAGILAINGLVSGSQTFAFGNAGTAPNVSSVGSVHTFNFPFASAVTTTAGVISNSDYSVFSTVVNKITSSAASLAQVLGYTPADNATVTTLSFTVNSVSSTLDAAQTNISSVSSTVNALTTTVAGKITSSSAALSQVLGYVPAASGTIASTQWTTSGSTIYYSTGRVGIGTSNPSAMLNINGIFDQDSLTIRAYPAQNSSWFKITDSADDTKVMFAPNGNSPLLRMGSSNTIQLIAEYGGYGEAPSGAMINVPGNLILQSTGGASAKTVLTYLNQTTYYSAAEVANTSSGFSNLLLMKSGGGVGVGVSVPNAKLHVGSGTAALPPIKIVSGTLTSAPSAGAFEYDGFNFYVTDGTNTRRAIAMSAVAGSYDNVNGISSTGNISMTPTGSVVVSSTSTSTNPQTGSLIVKGGLGVAGNTNLGGTLTVSNLVSATGYRAGQGIPNGTDSSTNGYAFGEDGDTGVFSPGSGGANGVLAFYSNNGERMRFTGSGAGIGTATPMAQLQVQKTTVASAAIMIGGALAGGPRIQTYGLDADPIGFMGLGSDMSGGPYESSNYFPLGNATNGFTTFGSYDGTNFSEKMRISANGRVGIATSSPQGTFQVGNGTNNSAFLYSVAPATSGVIRMTADASANWIQSGLDISNDSKKDLKFTSVNGVSTWMTLQASTGNVGIGTTNPQARLHVENNGPTAIFNSGYGNHFQINAAGDGYGGGAAPLILSGDPLGGTDWKFVRGIADANGTPEEMFYINGLGGTYFLGNMGLGTTSATEKLTVNGRGLFGPNFGWGESLVVGIDNTLHTTGTDHATVGATNGNLHLEPKNGFDTYINHYASGTGRILMATGNSSNGRVGIGTYSPNSKLDVSGSITLQGATLYGTTGDTGALNRWARLGRWKTHQLGRNLLIRFEGGQGFNANHTQISASEIRVRTSNATSVDGNGFCAAATVSGKGYYPVVQNVKIVADAPGCAASEFDIYVYLPPFVGQGNFFTVETDWGSSWINSTIMNTADPGAASDSVLHAAFENNFNGATQIPNGSLSVNTGTSIYTLDVSGTFRVSGQAYTNTGTANFSILSDIRYKDVTGHYQRGLEEILKIDTIRFKYKKDNPLGSDPANEYVGVSAQNLQEVIPEAVTVQHEKEKEFLTMNTSPVLWTMLNAIKQLYAKVIVIFENDQKQSREIATVQSRAEKLEQENLNLKKENDAVKARLERLEKLLDEKKP